MTRLTGWLLALRVARREALRARGRSLVALVMIALPVLAVTAADVILQTQDVDGVESLDRRLGAATALVAVPDEGRPVIQGPDPQQSLGSVENGPRHASAPTRAQLSAALGGARLVPEAEGEVRVRTEHGVGYAEALEVDLRDPVAAGLVRLTAGSLPDRPDQVVVNQALLAKGYAVGDRLRLTGRDAPQPVIVGVAESATVRSYPAVAGPVGSVGLGRHGPGAPTWLVAGAPVSWHTVRALNALGATVLSRAVIEHPPATSQLPPEIRDTSGTDDATVAVIVLVVVMALLEVVLLAGPAFAVSARRLARSLALMAAAGGTPAQSRRVVLAGGVVLGGVAAAVGVVLGIGAGALLVPVVQLRDSTWFGPFEVPWLHVLGVAGFGMLSAVLAAVVPAWIASRQDVVAVLAGRRADRRPSLRSPVLGLVLLGLGIAGSAYGARARGEIAIAAAAVVAVLGMILLVPVVVAAVARLAGRLPLPVRYAARDAARHRTRTVPAVAAVAATVAGVVALGIGVTSDEAENRATYSPTLPFGVAAVSDYGRQPRWDQLRSTVERQVPGIHPLVLTGVPEGRGYVDLAARRGHERLTLDSYGGIGTSLLVSSGTGLSLLPGLPAATRPAVERVLGSGGAIVFTDRPDSTGEARLRTVVHPPRGRPMRATATVPVLAVHVGPGSSGPRAVLSPEAARALAVPTAVVGLTFDAGSLTAAQQENLSEALTGVSPTVSFYVERGYVAPQSTVIVQLVLGALGAVLMLGGTLTATFLALSDARPDLATLSAVGASTRRRRSIAAAYALVIGSVGSLLGAAVGFVPGVAVTYPLTHPAYSARGPFLDVPWLLVVGLVVGLPLVTALVVAACTRSRLPLVARLD